jgi:hypothetical protein
MLERPTMASKLTSTQRDALYYLVRFGGARRGPLTLDRWRWATINRLISAGMIERIDPQPNWARNLAPRFVFYRATPAGIAAIGRLKA